MSKKKMFIIVSLLAAILTGGVSRTDAAAIGADKRQHIGACYAAELVLSEMKPFRKWKSWQRILFTTVVIGGAKEWYDSRHSNHSAEWGDIAADFAGASAAEGTLWLVHKTW